MKTSYLFFFTLFCHFSFGQLQESFSGVDLKNDSLWQGDTAFFIINSANQLQSQGSFGSIYLSTASDKIENAIWEFWVHIPFEPSSSNYPKIYLYADSANLKGSLHGYYIKVGGESGTSDGIELYKQNGTSVTKLIDGISGHVGKPDNVLRIRVSRDNIGNWSLFSDTTGGKQFNLEGKVFDNSFTRSVFCGVVYTFTTTRKNQFYFDDFFITDMPLIAEDVLAVSFSEVEVVFNKAVDKMSGENIQNYTLENLGHPLLAAKEKEFNKVKLTFSQKLSSGLYDLNIKSVEDSVGIPLDDQIISFYFKKPVQSGDLIITEIYPDPSPTNGLPGEEFVEIFNASSDTISLSGFTFSDSSTEATFPDIEINPSSYLILTSTDGLISYQGYGNVIGLNPWPSLNNSGDQIVLKDNHQNIISQVVYSDVWYGDVLKKEGGWTLEMINLNEFCKNDLDWTASQDPSGGTPGRQNSVFTSAADKEGPSVLSYNLADSNFVIFQFDESPDSTSLSSGFKIQNNQIVSVTAKEKSVGVKWSIPFEEGKETTVLITGIKDCLGNSAADKSFSVIRPSKEDSMDVIINEILFNPRPGGEDFVEIYNRSGKFIDLENWSIANMKGDTLYQKSFLSSGSLLVKPYEYRVVCLSGPILQSQYSVPYPDRIIDVSFMPSYNDDKGIVVLLNREGAEMDKFYYFQTYHSPLLKDKEGVSLERLSFYAPTNNSGNWYSASSAAGYATPGYENSEHSQGSSSKQVEIVPKVISPNGDNYNDLAYINYQFEKPGQICNLKIFNSGGRLIKRLADNQLVGEEGFFFWDGTDEKGSLVETGIYLIAFESFDPKTGTEHSFKESLVVANQF